MGERLSDDGEQLGPVNDTASTNKNVISPIVAAGSQTHWDVKVEGNGIFAQMPGYSSHWLSAGGGITTEFSYHWNSSVTTGLYVGYQGSQLTQTVTDAYRAFIDSVSSGVYNNQYKTTITDNAPRFGLFGSYGQPDGKGFYGFGLIGGTYHQYSYKNSEQVGAQTFPAPFQYVSFPAYSDNTSASIGAPELDSMVAGSYDFKAKGFTFGPTTSLQYTYYYQNAQNYVQTFITSGQSPSYYQSHNGPFNTSSLLYSLGGHVAYTWNAGQDLVIVPQINMSWQHQFLQTIYNQNDFSYQYPDAFLAGVGVTANYRQRYNASFFYNCYAGNQDAYAAGTQYFISQNIFLSLGVTF